MKAFGKGSAAKVTLPITVLVTMAWASSGLADEVVIDDPPEAPFVYQECYSAGHPDHPGPAAQFGEHVCVDYEATSSHVIQRTANDVGTTDVEWALFQFGTATIWAQSDGALVYEGPVEIEEFGQDRGNDGDCVWSSFDGGDDTRAWSGVCADLLGGVDFLDRKMELYGDPPFFYEAMNSGPDTWCAFDSNGRTYGAGCQ